MKKIYTAILFAGALFISNKATSQTYEAWGVTPDGHDYDTVFNYGDTLRYSFSGIMPGGFGNAKLVVYREGDFGDNGYEWIDIWEEATTDYIGTVGNNPAGDCAPEDSVNVLFSAALIDAWQSSGVLEIKVRASDGVDFSVCTQANRIKVRLVYDYCPFGPPVEFSSFSFSDDELCNTDAPVTMVGSPTGGTYSGVGVTGSQFNPAALNSGNYTVTYTATDGIGCITSTTETIKILPYPTPISELICEGSSPVLNTGSAQYGYFTDAAMTNALDTTALFNVPAVTVSPTMYYYSHYKQDIWFTLDTLSGTNSYTVDHAAASGDDRGGFAFTDSSFYYVGDNNTVRFNDLDLLTPPTSLPRRDGIFSDMGPNKVYSLYNTVSGTMPDNNISSTFEVDAFIALDADLNPTTEIIVLSAPIYLAWNVSKSSIFAGPCLKGIVGFF